MNVVPILVRDDIDFASYMANMDTKAKVISADQWKDDLIKALTDPEQIKGAKLPWGFTHENLRFRTGEVTIWQGINGHGKSQLLGMAAIGFMAQNESVCIASFEMKPLSTIMRMLRQAAMSRDPSVKFAGKFMDWLKGRCWIYNQLGTVTPEMIYGVVKYCSTELGVKHIIIDSLMKCVKGEDDYNGQKNFIDTITSLARDFNVHIHVVHHVRKSENEEKIPGKFDGKGSGSISDQVDQVLTVWRNKKKEAVLQREPDNADALNQPDAILSCDKNRHGEWEGRVALFFHAPSLQYITSKRREPLNLLEMQYGHRN